MTRAHGPDRREAFARDFILPAMQAGAMYDGRVVGRRAGIAEVRS